MGSLFAGLLRTAAAVMIPEITGWFRKLARNPNRSIPMEISLF
jgi:hypothetical protein